MKKLFMVLPLVLLLCFTFGCQKGEEVAEEPVVDVEADIEEGVKPLNVEGALFTYSIEGNGIPCVFFTGSENVGIRLLSKELKKHIKIIHADPKGISKVDVKSITLDSILDDIDKARIALGVEKIAVLGHSMFSIVPLEYALKYPEHASHAISTGGVPSFSEKSTKASNEYWEKDASEERKEIRRRNNEALTEEVMSKLSPSEAFIRQYVADTPLRFYDPEFDMTDLWEGVELNMDFINHFWGFIYGFDNTDKYHLIKAPVLIFAGRYDYGCPYFLYDEVKDIIPNYTFILLENGGHNPMFEIPEEFDKKLIDWIKSH
jgi:proline iminopeptidase